MNHRRSRINYQNQRKLKQAVSFLAEFAEREGVEARELPSLAVLAFKAGVSRSTMWHAVNRYREDAGDAGRVRGPEAQPTIPVARPSPLTDIPGRSVVRNSRSLELQAQIRRDILNARYRHDRPLPAGKELTATYGVSPMTLRKALLALAGQGILTRRASRFSPMSITPSASAATQHIVLLGQGPNIGWSITYGYWHQESYKLLELECAKARLALDTICFYREGSVLQMVDELPRRWRPRGIAGMPDVAGYIYLVTGPESFEDDLLGTVAASKRPVAIFDEMGIWPTPAFLKRHPNVRVFRNTISALPAQRVARQLLELGHRTAAYISPYHHLEYSRLRYDGIAREFAVAEGSRIIPVTSHHEAGQGPLPSGAEHYLDRMREVHIDEMKTIPSDYRYAAEDCYNPLSAAGREWRSREAVRALCEQALVVKDATAWILVNDSCASWALDFLEERRIAVPGNISIISFDDLPIALTKGISSLNFNYPAVMIAMLDYITNPRLYPVSRQVIEIEGQIIPRRRSVGQRKA